MMTNWVFLPNSTYSQAGKDFIPLTGTFERKAGVTNFYLPHWRVTLKPRVRVAIIDKAANRIIDYVNLASEQDLDVNAALMDGGQCGDPYTSSGSNGSMWCTNRMNNSTSDNVATYGIQNQIEASMGHTSPDWNPSTQEFPPGMSIISRHHLLQGPVPAGLPADLQHLQCPFPTVPKHLHAHLVAGE